MQKKKSLSSDSATTLSINLANCQTVEEVEESLSLMAQTANTSLSHAIRAQLQVVKYIAKPDLIGSTFDLFFKNLKKAIESAEYEEDVYDIRDNAALMLNNFIFFMKAKVEMEIAVNQKERAALLNEAATGLAESILSIGSLFAGGAGKTAIKKAAIDKLGNVLFNPDDINNSWLSRGIRWLFKKSRTEEKMNDFYDSLDQLAAKLIDQREVIGSNDLIAGIFENHYDGLIKHHSWEWMSEYAEADKYLDRTWQIPCWIIAIGGILGVAVWLVRWIVSFFTDMPDDWAQTQWMWTGITIGGMSLLVSLVFLCCYLYYKYKSNKAYRQCANYYSAIIEYFKE